MMLRVRVKRRQDAPPAAPAVQWPGLMNAAGAEVVVPVPTEEPAPGPYLWERYALDPFLEDYRRLVTTLGLEGGAPAGTTIAFAAPAAQAGASTVASCFALALARHRDQRVLLIDANFRTPALDRIFGVDPQPGLAEAVAGRCQPDSALRETRAPNLHLMPAGVPATDPLQVVTSARLRELIAELARDYACVIVDTAPIVANAESAVLAAQMTGTVLVVRAARTRREVVRNASDRLQAVRARVLGVVLNERRYTIPPFVYRRL